MMFAMNIICDTGSWEPDAICGTGGLQAWRAREPPGPWYDLDIGEKFCNSMHYNHSSNVVAENSGRPEMFIFRRPKTKNAPIISSNRAVRD